MVSREHDWQCYKHVTQVVLLALVAVLQMCHAGLTLTVVSEEHDRSVLSRRAMSFTQSACPSKLPSNVGAEVLRFHLKHDSVRQCRFQCILSGFILLKRTSKGVDA